MFEDRFFRCLYTAAPFFVLAALVSGCSSTPTAIPFPQATQANQSQISLLQGKINHIIIIYQENWGFDSLYGKFPGANGYASATQFGGVQTDANGVPLASLGPVLNGGKPDTRFPANLPVQPFDLAQYVNTSAMTGDPNHNYYIQQAQIDGGRMDRYLAYPSSSQGALTFGYFDATNLPEGQLAQQYTLADNFHQSTFGGSFLNNMWAACACTPLVQNPPPAVVEPVDANGNPTAIGGSEGRTTPDGYVVNTSYTTQYPQIVASGPNVFVPPLANPTLGDRLSAANITWAFYSGGLAKALAGTPDPTFQPHHQSYLYFSNYAPKTTGAANIKDFDASFAKDLASPNFPQVAWIKPLGQHNEHPGYANLMDGQNYVANLIGQIQMSKVWSDSLVIILYDEAGGHFDHVAPTPVDRWGPSTRVPAIFISPYMKRGFVDHTNYEVLSILKTIEVRFGLPALNARDANAAPILAPFDFTRPAATALARQGFRPTPPMPAPDLHPPHGTHAYPYTELDYDD